MADTLCLSCARCYGDCPWSERDPETKHIKFQPVPGWTAEATWNRGCGASYRVVACPLYVSDGKDYSAGRGQKPKYDVRAVSDCLRAGMTDAEIIKGGTGYGLDNKLPDEIEHIYPDYSLYSELTNDTAYGFLSRGCPRGCPFCIVADKEGRKSVKVADLSEWWRGQKNIVLMDPNTLACTNHIDLLGQLADSGAWVDINQGADARLLTEDNIAALNRVKLKTIHFAWDMMEQSEAVLRGLELYAKHGTIQDHRRRLVYVLTNYGTTMEENLYRIYKLRELDYDPYVMIYDKPYAPKEIKRLQRWCNNRIIFKSCEKFEDYR